MAARNRLCALALVLLAVPRAQQAPLRASAALPEAPFFVDIHLPVLGAAAEATRDASTLSSSPRLPPKAHATWHTGMVAHSVSCVHTHVSRRMTGCRSADWLRPRQTPGSTLRWATRRLTCGEQRRPTSPCS